MNSYEIIARGSLDDFLSYNKEYDAGKFEGSEATRFDFDSVKTWLAVRDKLEKVDEYSSGEWRTLPIASHRKKYGTNYIFIDIKNKKWRTRESASEFYGYLPPDFDINELA